MKGVQAWDCTDFHPNCPDVEPIDIGGFKYLWCPACRCLANLEAVAGKVPTIEVAKKTAQEKRNG